MTEKIKDFVEHELKMLDKGIVATPTEDYLENFSKANKGIHLLPKRARGNKIRQTWATFE